MNPKPDDCNEIIDELRKELQSEPGEVICDPRTMHEDPLAHLVAESLSLSRSPLDNFGNGPDRNTEELPKNVE